MKTSTNPARSRLAAIGRHLPAGIIICVVTLLILFTTVGWANYRLSHVVVHGAQVKGVITRLGARMDGRVRTVLVEPGQSVKEDQVLAVLENGHLQAALARMTAEHVAAVASLEAGQLAVEQERRMLVLTVDQAASQVTTAAAEIEGANSMLAKVERNLRRVATLRGSGINPASELESLEADREYAQAQLTGRQTLKYSAQIQQRQAETSLAGLKVKEAELAVRQANVKVAASRIDEAKADLEATFIRAPQDGWVVDRLVEAGGSAKVGEPMIALWVGEPWVEAWVPEASLRDVQIGSVVQLDVVAYPDLQLQGTVTGIGILTDKATRLPTSGKGDDLFAEPAYVPVKVSLQRTPKNLQPGLTVLAGIEVPGDRKTRVACAMGQVVAWIRYPFSIEPVNTSATKVSMNLK